MPAKFRTFDAQIYAGGEPSIKDLQYLKDILGVKLIVSLDDAVGKKIAPTVKQLKMQQVIIPVNPGATQITDPIKYLQRQIVNILSNYQPVYIHCLQGQDRTGLALAMYRILKQHMPCKNAIQEAKKYGYGLGISLQVQKLWESFLCALQVDSNATMDSDINHSMHDTFRINDVAPAFNPMQSFAPRGDVGPSGYPLEQKSQKRQEVLDEMLNKQVPMVGYFTNVGPMRGAGPVENSGMLTQI